MPKTEITNTSQPIEPEAVGPKPKLTNWPKIVLVTSLSLFVLSGTFIFWQYTLYQKLSRTDISCDGDWSYMVKCPLGSYCRSLGQGPLAGGLCKSWLSSVFGIFGLREEKQVPTPTPSPISTPETLLTYTTQDGRYRFQYQNGLRVSEGKPEFYENIISLKEGEEYVNSIVFWPPKSNPKFDNLEEDIKEGRGIFDAVGLEIEHTTVARQPALLFNKNPEGGHKGPVAYVKLDGRYIQFLGLDNPDSFYTVIESFQVLGKEGRVNDMVENWKTFSNGNFSYSVKYPSDWPTVPSIEVGEKTSGSGLHGPELKGQTAYLSKHLPDVKPPHLQIESFSDQSVSDFENRRASSCTASIFDVTETTVDDAQAVVGHRVTSDEPGQPYSTGHQYCALIYRNNMVYHLTWGEGSFEDSGLFNQILSTFKFLD